MIKAIRIFGGKNKKAIMELVDAWKNSPETVKIMKEVYNERKNFKLRGVDTEKYVLDLLRNGRISIEIAARLLKVNIHEIYRIAEKYNIRAGATLEQYKKGLEKAKRLFK